MAQYIDKAALVAEIDALQDATMENGHFLSSYHEGIFDGLSKIENFLDTLEVKEVNIEDAVKLWHEQHYKKKGTFDNYSGFYFVRKTQLEFAKHFFELGLKAQKGE